MSTIEALPLVSPAPASPAAPLPPDSVEEVLIELAERLRDPERWIQGYLHYAGRSCALGHLGNVMGFDLEVPAPTDAAVDRYRNIQDMLNGVARGLYGLPIASVNDSLGREAALKVAETALAQTMDTSLKEITAP